MCSDEFSLKKTCSVCKVSIVSLCVCYVTVLFYRLRLSLPLSCHYTIYSRFPLFRYLLVRPTSLLCSSLGLDCVFLCLLRHYISGVQRLLDARGQRGSWMPSKIFCIPLAKFLTTLF